MSLKYLSLGIALTVPDFESRNSDIDYKKKDLAKTIIKSYRGKLTKVKKELE